MKIFYKKILVALLCLVVAGCNNDLAESVKKTDDQVYDIIDNAWADNLGPACDYTISVDPNQVDDPDLTIDFSKIGILSLPKAVALASTYNRQYASEKELLYLTALEQVDVNHLYEPIPFAGLNGGQVKDGSDEAAGVSGDIGFSQLLSTGARIGSNISIGWFDILSGDMKSGLSTIASAVITQPLLRGAGRKVAFENLTQAQQNTLYQIRSFNRFRKEFITSVISGYYQVLIYQERRQNALEHLNNLQDTYNKFQKRAVAGKVSRHQFDQIEQDILQAESEYITRQKEYENVLDTFKTLMSVSPDTELELDANELAALKDSISQNVDMLSIDQSIDIALNQRLDLANAADKVIDAERKVDVAADAIRAELNLVGYGQTHAGNKNRGAFGASVGQLSRAQSEFELSLQLDLPLDRVAEKNAYRRAMITLVRMHREHQQVTDDIIMQIRNSYRRMKEARSKYQVELQNLRVARKRTDNSVLLLQYGRASTRDMLDAHEDLFESKDAVAETLVECITASLDYYRDTGMMKIRPDDTWENEIPAQNTVSKSE